MTAQHHYTDRSNASKAAKKAAERAGITAPKPGEHYAIHTHKGDQGPEFSFELLGGAAAAKDAAKATAKEPHPLDIPPELKRTGSPEEKARIDKAWEKRNAEVRASDPKAAKAEAAAAKEKATAKVLKKIAPDGQRVRHSTAEAAAAAAEGKLPTPPDFSAETHKRFRPKLAELVALAKAGDVAGLKRYEINPISTSPKAMDRYRNLAVIALEARSKGKVAAAAESRRPTTKRARAA